LARGGFASYFLFRPIINRERVFAAYIQSGLFSAWMETGFKGGLVENMPFSF